VSDLEPDYHRLHEFRYAIRRFLHFSEEAARAAGIDPQQHQLLLAVKAVGGSHGVSVGVLAERLQTRHHSTVELIDRAAEHGLVERARARDDRRHVLVSLTPAGEEMLLALSVEHIAELRQAGPTLIDMLLAITRAEAAPAARPRVRERATTGAARA
jgi:DNA-binding MarR family transcriptional regulator